MKKLQFGLSICLAITLFSMFSGLESEAQCAMCKASIESGLKDKNPNAFGGGLNNGILYLMSIPYLIFGVIAFMWYKKSKKIKNEKARIDFIIQSKMS